MKWLNPNSKDNNLLNNNRIKDEHENIHPLNNKYGPPEKKGLTVMIPVSSIWRWFKNRRKNIS